MNYLELIIVIILGLGWGSYATMATYRIPRSMPWIGDKPRCFSCKTPLTIIDYFSIISYFALKGKCRHCKAPYECGVSYFFTEFLILIFFLLAYFNMGLGDKFVLVSLLIVNLVILAIISAESKVRPDKVLIMLFILSALYRQYEDLQFYGILYNGLFGLVVAILLRAIYIRQMGGKLIDGFDFLVWKPEGRFSGQYFDYVKLSGIIAILLGYELFIITAVISTVISTLWYYLHRKTFDFPAIISITATILLIYF